MSALAVVADIEVHPFLADLPVFEAEVAAIEESIREVGLLHPVTLDAEGRLIGGRHRLAACERAGVEPTFETFDGDPLTFMAHDNAARKHHSAGQRAAESALLLSAAGLRVAGRWDGAKGRGLIRPDDGTNQKTWNNLHAQAGLILDHLGRDALVAVALGDRTLSEVHTEAERARDAERDRLEREERIAAEEADAKTFIQDTAPGLAAQVGDVFQTYAEALAVWQKRNREEAERIERQKAAEREQERALDQGRKDTCQRIAECVRFLEGGEDYAEVFVRDFYPHEGRFLADGMRLTRDRVRSALAFLTAVEKELP